MTLVHGFGMDAGTVLNGTAWDLVMWHETALELAEAMAPAKA